MRLVASTQPDTTEVCNHLQPKAIPLPSLLFSGLGKYDPS